MRPFHLRRFSLVVGGRVLETLGSREVSVKTIGPVCFGTESPISRNRERITARGLNHNHNHDLKNLFKGAAQSASARPGPLCDFYLALVEKGMRPTMARLTLARKIAAITLILWKKGVNFDAKQLNRQAA